MTKLGKPSLNISVAAAGASHGRVEPRGGAGGGGGG